MLATQVSGVPFKNAKPKTRKENVEKDCPRCGKKIAYSQRTKANSVKAFACAECGCSLYSRQSDGAFLLRERKPTEEKLACPDCGFEGTLALDPVHGGTADFECAQCHSLYRAVRKAKDVNLSPSRRAMICFGRLRSPRNFWGALEMQWARNRGLAAERVMSRLNSGLPAQ